jgi:hypothetical protein
VRAVRRPRWRCSAALLWFALAVPAAVSWTADPAAAEEITGDCSGTVNGREAASITSDDPVVLREGQSLTVTGGVPFGEAADNPVSNTTVKVSLIDGVVGITSDEQPSTGATYTSNNVGIEDYFDFGVGLYRIDVTNIGDDWECTFTGYVKLEGGTLSKPIGLIAFGAVVIGVIGLLFAKGRKPREPGWIDGGLATSDQIAREEAWQAAGSEYPEAVRFDERGQHGFLPLEQLAPNERVIWTGKVRIFGHPLAGVLWGLMLGVGVGLLGWQQARWTVNVGSIVILPLVVAALSLLLAWAGWGYRIRDVAVLPAPPQPEAAAGFGVAAVDADAPEPEAEPAEVADPPVDGEPAAEPEPAEAAVDRNAESDESGDEASEVSEANVGAAERASASRVSRRAASEDDKQE